MKLLFQWLFVARLKVAREGLPTPKKEQRAQNISCFVAGRPRGMHAGAFSFVYALAQEVGEMARFVFGEGSPALRRGGAMPWELQPAKCGTRGPGAHPALQPHPHADLFR